MRLITTAGRRFYVAILREVCGFTAPKSESPTRRYHARGFLRANHRARRAKVKGTSARLRTNLRRGGRFLWLGHMGPRLGAAWDRRMSVPWPWARSKRALQLPFLAQNAVALWDTRGARRAGRGLLWLVLTAWPTHLSRGRST
eukprot:scaffold22961_cov29-Phaeocystis_antarctica.AAC.2